MSKDHGLGPPGEKPGQRLDKWLYFCRVTKTRSLAQKLIKSGAVRVDGTRITKAGTMIHQPSVLTIAHNNHVRILRFVLPGTRRGSAAEASRLYQDLSPPRPAKNPIAENFSRSSKHGTSPAEPERKQLSHTGVQGQA